MLTCEQARDLVAWAGSVNAAARETATPRSTLIYWLNPEKVRERLRGAYADDPESKRARERERYYSETNLQHAYRMLRMRRTKALHRRAQREQRRATRGPL